MVTKEKTQTQNENKASQTDCSDIRCAIHGELKIRGRVFQGTVISDKMQRTVTVEWPRLSYLPKFERYEKRRSRVKAHNPPCIAAKEGDTVRIAECRPIAKTVKFVVIEKLIGVTK
jgi:small subunit ribosomal protein S17